MYINRTMARNIITADVSQPTEQIRTMTTHTCVFIGSQSCYAVLIGRSPIGRMRRCRLSPVVAVANRAHGIAALKRLVMDLLNVDWDPRPIDEMYIFEIMAGGAIRVPPACIVFFLIEDKPIGCIKEVPVIFTLVEGRAAGDKDEKTARKNYICEYSLHFEEFPFPA